jgi:hypothetical protein
VQNYRAGEIKLLKIEINSASARFWQTPNLIKSSQR